MKHLSSPIIFPYNCSNCLRNLSELFIAEGIGFFGHFILISEAIAASHPTVLPYDSNLTIAKFYDGGSPLFIDTHCNSLEN